MSYETCYAIGMVLGSWLVRFRDGFFFALGAIVAARLLGVGL